MPALLAAGDPSVGASSGYWGDPPHMHQLALPALPGNRSLLAAPLLAGLARAGH